MAEIDKLVINDYTMESIYTKIGISYDRFVEILDRDFYTPTLSSAPTESTTTYIDTDGSVCRFRVGQFCRVADETQDSGYRMYQCVDIQSDVRGVFVSWQADIDTLKSYIDSQLDNYATKEYVDSVAGGGSGGGNIDMDELISRITTVVDTYRNELNATVGNMQPVMDDINDEEELDEASALLDEINGEVI